MKFSQIHEFNLQPGRSIAGKYKVISKLGAGWEGEVYKVRETKTGLERAAKLFFPQRNIRERASKIYAKKLYHLRNCSLLIQYLNQEEIIFKKIPISVLISEYVEGILLSEFLKNFRGNRLEPYKALHLLYALTQGIEEIHLKKEYHGDLHTDNIIVNKFGLTVELKLLDLFHYGSAKPIFFKEDLIGLIHIFYEVLGGKTTYAQQPRIVKDICCGLKKSLILKKYKHISELKKSLEALEWA